ncbi:STAS domain-containing protein [uncultured Jatrophihabitans sp.]|uniref:STAS domain-containing protein n=1 Tax=uncultured Jatrophihabitans sp. TaxID=1610747 RepID=UPI0035CA28B9
MTHAPAAYALAGEVDASTAPFHLERLQAMIAKSPSDSVVVELDRTRMLDTTGLGMLINARKSASDAGKRLVLRGANHRLVRLMEIAGTYELFDWEP